MGYVDYEKNAALYQRGRALSPAVLDRWGDAVRPYLPSRPLRVGDVGAGTGIFARAWPTWAVSGVIAVEPTQAMAHQADIDDAAVSFVRGVVEDLPLAPASIDVVWVSTALHHFADVDRSLDEFTRVLRPEGRVLVRTYVPDRAGFTFLDEFPGRSKWVARYLDEAGLVRLFGRHGFGVVDVVDVAERTETYAQSAEWVSMMRNADSILTALDDSDIALGLAALRSNADWVGRMGLTLFVFERG